MFLQEVFKKNPIDALDQETLFTIYKFFENNLNVSETARKLFVAFPALKDQLYGGHLWSPSYYVGTAGNVSAETIRHYIERTEHIKGRR